MNYQETSEGTRGETVFPLEQGLSEIRSAVGERAGQLFPESRSVSGINREDYISRTYAHEEGPTIKQTVDGHLYEVSFQDGSRTYVLRNRTDNGNPFANPDVFGEFLPGGGLDMRTWQTYTYEWDGKNSIKATEPNGKVTEVTGQWGVPDAMLPTLRQVLGHSNGSVRFAPPQSSQAGMPPS